MGCCSSSPPVAPAGDKTREGKTLQKGAITDGPVKNRKCRDVLCLVLFIVHLVGYVLVSMAGVSGGNPSKLIAPRDSYGMYCGIQTQWSGYPASIIEAGSLEHFEYMIFTLNVSSTIDGIAEKLACSTGIQTQLVTVTEVMNETEFQAACGRTLTSMDLGAEVTNYVTTEIEKYTNPAQVTSLLTGTGGTSMFNEITKYFFSTCVSTCDLTTDPIVTPRLYTYSPSPDVAWYSVWRQIQVSEAMASLLEKFKFKALPTSACPYTSAKHCIPLPGIEFIELLNGYCTFKISGKIANALGDAAGSALEGLAQSSIVKSLEGGLDQSLGNVQSSWNVSIIVAVLSFVVSLSFLVLLRFFVCPVVWLIILLTEMFWLAGGAFAMAYAAMCKDDDLQNLANAGAINITLSGVSDCHLYEIEDEGVRTVLWWLGIVLFVVALLWLILICCLCEKIRLAIEITEVAASFVYSTPDVVLLPIIQFLVVTMYFVIWLLLVSFLISQVPPGYVPDSAFESWAVAMGTSDTAGKCNDAWPTGTAYKAELDDQCIDNKRCWRCYPPRYMLDIRFAFVFFSFLWNNAFIVACNQCMIAGACAVWFFTPISVDTRQSKQSKKAVSTGVYNCLRYSLGSMAFGSLILAIVEFLKYVLKYLAEKSKVRKNKFAECVFKCLAYCIWCFENCLRFLSKQAYIQVAIMGTDFCTATRKAFELLVLRNAIRFGILIGLGSVIRILGKYFIAAATAFSGFFVLQAMYPEISSPVALVCLYFGMGYVVGSCFMNVFELSIDTTLQCFVAAEEMKMDKNIIPRDLRQFLEGKDGSTKYSPSAVAPSG